MIDPSKVILVGLQQAALNDALQARVRPAHHFIDLVTCPTATCFGATTRETAGKRADPVPTYIRVGSASRFQGLWVSPADDVGHWGSFDALH